jgi:arylsulfatase A-like enzyme
VSSRRQFLARAAAATTAAAAATVAFPAVLRAQATRPAAAGRPNVLFIPVDDLRPQLGCYGHRQMVTPNLDRLAASGALFERAYCQQAVCAPSRISLLTGCRPDTTRIYDLRSPLSEHAPHLVSLPRRFRQGGYETVSLGKVFHHPGDDRDAWSQRPWHASDAWIHYEQPEHVAQQAEAQRRLEAAHAERAATRPQLATRPAGRAKGPPTDAADVPDDAYGDGQLAARAIGELRRLKGLRDDAGTPFFLATGCYAPHLPFNCPKKYWDLYDPDAIDLADNPFPPAGAPQIALSNSGELRQYLGVPKQGDVDEALARHLVHGYYAATSYVDAQIGKVLDALDALGLRDDTVVCLWGDHGWHLGDHGLWCKHTNFETAVHSPLLLAGPGVPPGVRTRALTEFVDVFPTLCEMTGVEPPADQLEGTSVVPLLADPGREWKTAAFSQYPRPGDVMGHSVKTDRHRFTRWAKRDGGREVVATELYDHQTDPAENANLAADPAHAATAAALSKVLDDGWRAARPPRA